MKKLLLISTVLLSLFMSSCKKSNETDYASKWEGIYINKNAAPSASTDVQINNIVISGTSPSTMKVLIKGLEASYIYTFTTLNSVTVNGITKASINETVSIAESTGQYNVKGTMTMAGDVVTLSAIATPVNSDISKETDVKTISFSGTRK